MRIISSSELDESYFSDDFIDDLDIVNEIVDEVRIQGDQAVRHYTTKFDGLDLENYIITKDEIEDAYEQLGTNEIASLRYAAKNIRKFAEFQLTAFQSIETESFGYRVGHKVVPLSSVGCYAPGGRYPLPSSALMTIIPAKVAGVQEIVLCSPKIAAETIVAADIAGADKIFKIGGAQAIAALAFGTETIPRVDKIVGPGNKYVTAAKKRVYGSVGIDFLAGPSEVMVIADDTADPEIIAADLLAQAEHDPLARADLLTVSETLAQQVLMQVNNQLDLLRTKDIASKAIDHSFIILVENLDQAVEIANKKAPEHLELQLIDNDLIINRLTNYGSLFIGPFSAEVFGDYCSGPNHTLPTNRVARFTGGLSVKEYIKIMTYQELKKDSMKDLIDNSSSLANMEGLHAHQRAAEIRKKLL